MLREVVIAAAARTPIGTFGGSLTSVSAVELGAVAAREAIRRAGIAADQIDETIAGCILQAGLGQNVARQLAIRAGVPDSKPALTINLLCGSGLRAVSMAAQMILLGDAEVVLAGGTESMSNAPYLAPAARWGARMGDAVLQDSMVLDALTDAFGGYHMGITAENIAERWKISREEQDQFALASQHKAEAAQQAGRFAEEIVAVEIPQRKGPALSVATDEGPRAGMKLENLSKLRPAFKPDGTVTAGNASGINDGAAMVVVMSGEKARALGVRPLATIVAYGTSALDPAIMGYGPVLATRIALERAGMRVDELDLIEANEAFAAQSIAVTRDLAFDPERVNVNGGAIALGHPVGASGARVLTTLLYEMARRESKTGLATLCIGGGMGTALIVRRD